MKTCSDPDDTRSSIVGDGGVVYLVGPAGKRGLWSNGQTRVPVVRRHYSLTGAKPQAEIEFINGQASCSENEFM
ncbi:TPA: hypothetical protein QHU55_002627 [Klebsiella aerogenes]|uniref:hypothetical protein n=1 Tax=Klebsiella aerogenes TaxID=548 RepID=UPI0027696D3C|nr:hypothetical protein [Klebsiella aerogenes]HDS6532686.1 hypothetical protein [Klebsiella aerogenes]HDS7500327.1 hypothetical protein [Klebsiella aerogenes]HDS9641963.1 hypothetical protein [Klebsiella aerogenes]HDT0787866.1 hypothetical protein [Klebsiella aerogenes]